MNIRKEKLFKRCCLYLALILLSTAPVFAQDEQDNKLTILSTEAPSLRFEHLGLEDGMAQSSAYTIMQDSQGYLWISTYGGLHRYDGHEFKVYESIPFDTTSLSESWVWAATEAKNGNIWVTTEGGGLNRMDRATGNFKHYLHDPDDSTSISSNQTYFPMESSNGDLWVSTRDNGLNRMKAGKDGTFTRYTHDPDNLNSLSNDTTYWITEYEDGNIWVGSRNGLNRIDPETDSITRFFYDPEGSRVAQRVYDHYHPVGHPGIIWLATGNGLVRLNTEADTHERFLIGPNEDRTNPLTRLYQVVPDPTDPDVLWVGGPGTGVARFDMRTKTFMAYRHDPRDPHSLRDNYVQSLFADRSGTMWVGTYAEGMSTFNPGAVNFTHLRHNPDDAQSLAPGIVFGIYEDRGGSLWVGTDVPSGMYLTRFDTKTGKTRRFQHDPNDPGTLLPGSLRVFAEDNSGQFWVGGDGGLIRLDRATGRVTRFLHENTRENRERNNIRAMFPMASDSSILLIGSIGGIDRFDTQTGKYTRIPIKLDGMEEDPMVFSLHESIARADDDVPDTFWAGTSEGLLRIDPSGEVTIASAYKSNDTTTISDNNVNSITERANEPGVLWLSTQDGGLNRFDTRTGIATHYTDKNGLANNHLYSVLTDESGTLWMSTNSGIINFDPETETARNYGLDNGLMALEYSYNAYAKGKGGVLYFGSAIGVTAFVPEQLHINQIPPQVILSDFKLLNKSVAVGPNSPLKQPLSKAKSITLNYNQNEFTFDYVALHFANAAKNTYAYQLEGFDTEWVDAGTKRSATYTNLAPGDYTFRVKAANADGVWNEKGTSIGLSVLPPWYRSWYAYLVYLLLFFAGVLSVHRVQKAHTIRNEKEKTQQRELEQAKKIERAYNDLKKARKKEQAQTKQIEEAYHNLETAHKNLEAAQKQLVQQEKLASLGQLTAGIAHEIKNPLNFVKNFSEVSIEMIEEARQELSAFSNQQTADVKSEKSPSAEGTPLEEEGKIGEAVKGDDRGVVLEILNDIETNLRKIHEHGHRADRIVKSMLQHSRGGTGRMEPTKLNALVKEFVNLAFHGMRAGKNPFNVDIEMNLDETIGEVPLIAEDFSRVIVNLCSNAFDAMRQKANSKDLQGFENLGGLDPYVPKLTVRTRRKDENIVVEIEDNGPGIPKEFRDKILQPFFTTKKGTDGTGLGLYITNDIAKAHGGDLKVVTKKGEGSRFSIELPLT